MSGPEVSEPPLGDLGPSPRRRSVDPRWLALSVLVVVLLGVSAWAIGQQFTSSSPKRPLHVAAAYATFRDPTGLFQGGYPSTWKVVQTNNPADILLAEGPNGASYQVAKTPLTAAVNATNLVAAKKLTDRIVSRGPGVKLVKTTYHQPGQVSIGGLPGYLYLYTFVDPTTGETGAHAHYFLFDGKTMITLVFQSLPSNNFVALAPIFDHMASTFRALRH